MTLNQSDINFRGHAIECRINAEDSVNFIPNPGKITRMHIPGGFGIRMTHIFIMAMKFHLTMTQCWQK